MKFLLIFPPDTSVLSQGSLEQFKDIDVGFYPPLGVMYVAAYVLKNSHHEVEVLDANVERMTFNAIENEVRRRKPDVVGTYATSFTLYDSYEVVKAVKRADESLKVIMGGPHVDIYPEETLGLQGVDFIVMGEGEKTVTELLNCMEHGDDPEYSKVAGIGYKVNGHAKLNARRDYHHSLDDVPFPARQCTPHEKYYSLIGKNAISTTIMSSRGCPSSCNFCYIQYGKSLRMRSPKNVCDELEECVGMGIKEFFFFDENFTMNKKRVAAICQEIVDRRLGIYFDIRSRVNTVDEEVLSKLKEAGCERIQFGVESGVPEIIKAMNKRISIDEVRRAFKLSKKAGITTYADFMVGYPGETKEQMQQTIDFAKDLDPDYVQFGITMLFPQTKIYEEAMASGFLKEDFWKNAARNPSEYMKPPLASRTYSSEELELIQKKASLDFYLRPGYMLRRLVKIRSLVELKRQSIAGFSVIGKRLGLN